jgi:hypothetical protein
MANDATTSSNPSVVPMQNEELEKTSFDVKVSH